MNLHRLFIILVILLSLSDAIFWGRRRRRRRRRRRAAPPPCSWSTCKHEWKDDWNPSIQNGRCVNQNRKAHHKYTTHHGTGSCPSATKCSPEWQHRTMCSCTHAYYCPFHAWTSWSGSVSQGSCGQQSRYRDYNTHIRYDVRSDNCNGIPSSCGSRQYSYRKLCSCKNAYYCPLYSWTSWSGAVTHGTCAQQHRYRDYNTHIRYDVRSDNCNGIPSSCGSRKYSYRKMCSCQYASCSLGAWSTWYDLSSPIGNHCASQERKRRYVKRWLYLVRSDNCNGVGPQSCPNDLVERREKVITCPALGNPLHGSWNPGDCRTKESICRTICQLRCDIINGFELRGPDTRKCLPSGQWSTPWSSYCQDVRPPSITCPQSISVGTDPGKPTAKITIPSASAYDNSGQQPTITNDAEASEKEFVVSSIPHEVHYSARDAAGLTATCTLQITVQDLERPRVASCPKDIKHQTNKNEIRVTWKYPEFEDNFDKPPLQLSITSNRNPGVLFPWGRYDVVYTATDRAGNKVACEFFVEVAPINCTYFDAPAYGVRTCNIQTQNTNNVRYEMVCIIQCKEGYSFADPQAVNTYLCQSDGTWNRLFYGGRLLIPVYPKSQRPWPDCAPDENVKAARKSFTFYAGSCSGDEQNAVERIKMNFLEAVNNSLLAKIALCDSSNNQDCHIENVKVYCGRNSKRSLGSMDGRLIVTLDFVIQDTNATDDKKKETKIVKKLMQDLDIFAEVIKQKLPIESHMPQLQVEAGNSSVACPTGKVMMVKSGIGSELERTVCVECPVGTFYSNESQTCETCQAGTYQNRTGQTSCDPCPKGTWTVGVHAKNYTECFEICEPGEYTVQEESGVINCLMCPIGTYQPYFHASICLSCPPGETTPRKGAVHINDCQ